MIGSDPPLPIDRAQPADSAGAGRNGSGCLMGTFLAGILAGIKTAFLPFIDGNNSPVPPLRRDSLELPMSAEPVVFDFEILSAILVNQAAVFTGANGQNYAGSAGLISEVSVR